jgi:hypothetical protein
MASGEDPQVSQLLLSLPYRGPRVLLMVDQGSGVHEERYARNQEAIGQVHIIHAPAHIFFIEPAHA